MSGHAAGGRDRRTVLLWGGSLLAVLAVHLLVFRLLSEMVPVPEMQVPDAIMIDLAPAQDVPPLQPPQEVPPPPAPPPAVTPPPVPPPPPEPAPPQPTPLEPPPPPPDPVPAVVPADILPLPLPVPPVLPAPVVPVPPPPKPRPVPRAATPRPPAVTPPPPNVAQAPVASAPAPAPAPAAPSPPSPEIATNWQSRLLSHLARFKRFPMDAQRRGEQGVVLMRFRMDRTGHLLSASMARSSGYADLDTEAEAWIARADPLPAPPPELGQAVMELVVPLRFSLH